MDICNSANALDAEERIMVCGGKNINQAPEFQEQYLICLKSHLAQSANYKNCGFLLFFTTIIIIYLFI